MSTDVQAADVFKIRIQTDLSFMVQDVNTLKVLSQPIDQNGQAMNVVDYLLPGERGSYAGCNQTYSLPNWSARLM